MKSAPGSDPSSGTVQDSAPSDPSTVTALLDSWKHGDQGSAERLFDVLYGDLRRLAASKMRRERSGHTLQPTAIVHELYLRLSDGNAVAARGREHFLAIAARVMARILTDYAREHRAQKRGGGALAITLDPDLASTSMQTVDVLDLAEALDRLETIDARKAEIVRQRFLCGATVEEVATSLGVSSRTIKREWNFSRAWLLQQLAGTQND